MFCLLRLDMANKWELARERKETVILYSPPEESQEQATSLFLKLNWYDI